MPVPTRPAPDRFGDAVRSRRRELRDRRALLHGSARTALRDALAAARAATLADVAADLADLRRQIDGHPAAAVGAAARAVEEAAHARWAERAVAAERGTAADRGVAVPVPPDDPLPARVADPRPPTRTGPGAALADPGVWRLAGLPLVVASLCGFAGPAVLLPALGTAVLLLVVVVRFRRAATDRARLLRWSTDLLADTHSRIDAELARRAVVRAAAAGARLDAALTERRKAVESEIALLTPEVDDAP
jgi:hypothetical protein